MKKVLMLSGPSHGNALDGIAAGFAPMYEAQGYEFVLVNAYDAQGQEKLRTTLVKGNIAFALSLTGTHSDVTLTKADGQVANLWHTMNIPFLSLLGDGPFYFFDRHVALSPSHALGYGFADHLLVRKRYPKADGVSFVIPPAPLNTEPLDQIDFSAKVKGKLLFLKNGNSPHGLVAQWQRTMSPEIAQALLEMAEILTASDAIEDCHGTRIDDTVTSYYAERGIDIEPLTKLRLLLCAQLDDYVRRIKSNLLATVLSDYPVVINGFNWEHIDFSNKACTFIPGADWEKSRQMVRTGLGMIDMSPNTTHGLHDRITRSLGAYTTCLTNEQQMVTDGFGDLASRMTFKFNKESIRHRVEAALADPASTVELGVATSQHFRQRFTMENLARCTILVADSLRLAASTRLQDQQEYVVWPPSTLN
jgi:hypothetical protein